MANILNWASYIREIEEELGEEVVEELWLRWDLDPLDEVRKSYSSWESYIISEYERVRRSA